MTDVLDAPDKAAVGKPHELAELIHAAYIDPVRSVLVVDDEFPSLDKLIAEIVNDVREESPVRSRDAEYVQEILQVCRRRERPWLVDVHDGKQTTVGQEVKVAHALHHSDLMILDFHLNGDLGGGDAAISVLRSLSKNGFFNLVVVYTRGYETPGGVGDLRRVFDEIVQSLISIGSGAKLKIAAERFQLEVEEWEFTDSSVVRKLEDSFGVSDLLAECSSPGTYLTSEACGRLKNLLDHAPSSLAPALEDGVAWLVLRTAERVGVPIVDEIIPPLDACYSERGNWIRTTNLFLTVVSKAVRPGQLEKRLVDMLALSEPVPHQLLMARMRAEIDRRGASIEAYVLSDRKMQYGWLRDLLHSESDSRAEVVASTIDRHWEALGDGVRQSIERYVSEIVDALASRPANEVLEHYYPKMDLTDDVLFAMNSYVSTKPLRSAHLMTGQVLELESGVDDDNRYWICLSPACDLVPKQKGKEDLGGRKPFVAAQLHPIALKKALEKASYSTSLFLTINGVQRSFSICPRNDVSAFPIWEHMYALDGGRFGTDAVVKVLRARADENEEFIFRQSDVHVVGQLRYEYAINLMHRLSGALGRVGLDYKKR